ADVDVHTLDRRREIDEIGDGARVILERQMPAVRVLVDVGLDHHVFRGYRAAREAATFLALHIHQREGGGRTMVEFPFDDLYLASAAKPVATSVRQIDAGAQRRIEDGLPFLDLDGVAERLDRDL